MPKKSPFDIVLTGAEKEILEAKVRQYTSSYIDVVRAKIVLYAAEGLENKDIAARLDTSARSCVSGVSASSNAASKRPTSAE